MVLQQRSTRRSRLGPSWGRRGLKSALVNLPLPTQEKMFHEATMVDVVPQSLLRPQDSKSRWGLGHDTMHCQAVLALAQLQPS